jgi:hypothetical protein
MLVRTGLLVLLILQENARTEAAHPTLLKIQEFKLQPPDHLP